MLAVIKHTKLDIITCYQSGQCIISTHTTASARVPKMISLLPPSRVHTFAEAYGSLLFCGRCPLA